MSVLVKSDETCSRQDFTLSERTGIGQSAVRMVTLFTSLKKIDSGYKVLMMAALHYGTYMLYTAVENYKGGCICISR